MCVAPRASTQQAMDQAYAAPAGIYLAFRLQLAGKFVVLCTAFGSAIPVLYAIAAGYFWLAGWIDRYNLLRRLAPPPVTDASLTASVAIVVFPIAVCLHVIMALVFFSAQAKLHDTLHDTPANATAPTTALLDANATVGVSTATSVVAVPTSLATGTAASWDAYHIQLATSALALGGLSFFALREIARHLGVRIRLLSEAQTNVVLKVITQEPDEAQAAALVGAAVQTAAHSNHVYLPPLPSTLLHELGLDEQARRVAIESVNEVTNAANRAAERSAMDSFIPGGNAAGGRASFRSPPPAALNAERLSVGGGERHSAPTNGDEPMHVARTITLDRATSFDQQTRTSWQEHERRFSERAICESPAGAPASPARTRAQPHATTPSRITPIPRQSAREQAADGTPASQPSTSRV